MKNYFSIVLFSISCFTSFSQEPVIVSDFFEGAGSAFEEEDFEGLVLDEQTMIFPVSDTMIGEELGVLKNGVLSLLKEINPGVNSSNPRAFVLYNEAVYFAAIDDANGGAIWKTDGTESGTEIVIDVDSSNLTTRPQGLIVSNSNHLYFTFGSRLYKSDGTQQGTQQIASNAKFELETIVQSPKYCTYEQGVAYLTKKDDTIQVFAAVDSAVLLGQINERSRWGDIYGLSEVKAGLIFSVDDFTDDDISSTWVFNNQTQALDRLRIGTEYPFMRRTMKLDDEKQIAPVGFGTTDYYSLTGFESENEILGFSSSVTFAQRQKLEHIKVDDKIVFHFASPFGSGELVAMTDGTKQGTQVFAKTEQSYISNMISYGKYAFWTTGVINFFNPEFYYTDTEQGITERFYYWNEDSEWGPSVLPLGVQGDKLYFLSNMDQSIGRELYSIDLTFGIFSSTKEKVSSIPFEIIQYDDGFFVKSEKNEELIVKIFDVTGRELKSIKMMSNSFLNQEQKNQILFYNFRKENYQVTKKSF